MNIYYPDKKLLFKITSQSSFTLSFLTPFIAALRNDYGFSDLKYEMKNFKMNSDTLITEWHPPKNLKKKLRIAITKIISDKVIEVIFLDPSGKKLLQKILLKNHSLINNTYWFPKSVTIFKYDSENQYYDKIDLEKISIDTALPDSILEFTPPDNITIKEYKW